MNSQVTSILLWTVKEQVISPLWEASQNSEYLFGSVFQLFEVIRLQFSIAWFSQRMTVVTMTFLRYSFMENKPLSR